MTPLRALFAIATATCAARPRVHGVPAARLPHTHFARGLVGAGGPSAPSLNVDLIAFGGDPTGHNDSSAALAAAWAAAVALGATAPASDGSSGVTLDLGGGRFLLRAGLVSRAPLAPTNIVIAGGTLVADAAFPAGGFLLDIENAQQLVLRGVTLDGSRVASCLRLDSVVGVVVEAVYFLHYAGFGLLADSAHGSSHELLVTDAVFAEANWGESGFDDIDALSGVAIFIATVAAPQWRGFGDSMFYSTIVRCSRAGIINLGGSNLFSGVHLWPTCNKSPVPGNVSVGFYSAGDETRISNAQFDDSPVIVTNLRELILTDSFFYELAGLVFAPQAGWWDPGLVSVVHNDFAMHGVSAPYIHYDTSSAALAPGSWRAFVVAENTFANASRRLSTRASLSVPVAIPAAVCVPDGAGGAGSECTGAARAQADARSQLLLLPSDAPPPIDWRASLGPRILAYIAAGSPTLVGEAGMEAAAAAHTLAAPPPPPPPFFSGGALAAASGAVITGNASCDGAPAGAGAAVAAWALEPARDAGGAEVPGLLEAAVRVSVSCPPGTRAAAWAGTLALQLDQSPP